MIYNQIVTWTAFAILAMFQQIFSILKQSNINPGWLTGTGQLFLMKSAPASNTSLSKSLLCVNFNSDFQQDSHSYSNIHGEEDDVAA